MPISVISIENVLSKFKEYCCSKISIYIAAVGTLVLCLFLFSFSNTEARIFQFDEGDANYFAALEEAAKDITQQVETELNTEEKINLDENFKPEDFGIKNVGILPTSPFYFLKNLGRGATDLFTFSPVKKAELKIKFAAEKLLETQTLSESDKAKEGDIKKSLDNFNDEIEKVKNHIEKIADKIKPEESDKLVEKLIDSTTKYEKTLGKLEKNIPSEIFKNFKDAKDQNSSALATVFNLTEPEKASEKIVEVLDKQAGSDFKNFKNIEILKEVQNKVPDKAKDAIRLAEENILNRLQIELEKFETAKKAIFEDFVKNIGGSELRHLEIINDLDARPMSDDLRQIISRTKEETLSKTENRLTNFKDNILAKDNFLDHLNTGDLENIRLIKDLENSLPDQLRGDVSGVKQSAEKKFVEKIKEADQNDQYKKEVFENVDRFHDIKSISIFDDIQSLIPDDKKGFFETLKQKAVGQIKKDVEQARNEQQRELILSSLVSDNPSQIRSIDNFQKDENILNFLGNDILNSLRQAQFNSVMKRADNIRDKDRFVKFEEEFRQREDSFSPFFENFAKPKEAIGGNIQEMQTPTINVFDFFADKKSIFESSDRAENEIRVAESVIAELRNLINQISLDSFLNDGGLRSVKELLLLSERKLERARIVLSYDDVGRAFGDAQFAKDNARRGIEMIKNYKTGKKEAPKNIEFLPFNFNFTKPTFTQPAQPEISRTIGGTSIPYQIYNEYEFKRFCYSMGGFLKSSLKCSLPGNREWTIVSRDAFPISVPPEFMPNMPTQEEVKKEYQEQRSFECPLFGNVPADFCKTGTIIKEIDPYGCALPPRCETSQDPLFPRKDIYNTCLAYWQGYIFDAGKNICRIDSSSGCSDPYSFHSIQECERANNIGSPIIKPIAPTICPAMPTVSTCPTGQKLVLDWSSPECGSFYKCIIDSGSNPSTYPGDANSCPGFAYSMWDSTAKRYCRLNESYSCNYNYPSYLDRTTYKPENCPAQLIVDSYCGDGACQNNETSTSCPTDCGGSTTTTCSKELITLLGTGCHSMSSGWFNTEMTKYALFGTTAIKDCATTYASGCTGGGTSACNYNGTCDSGESSGSCPGDCGGSSNWLKHIWKFKDGLSETSMILNRTDSEYLNYVTGIEGQCLQISRNQFAWKPGAGNDSSGNWQNFGIPDCSGSASVSPGYCGDRTCQSTETLTSCPTDCVNNTTTTCPSGNYWDGAACVPSTPPPPVTTTCPSGQTLDSTTNTCKSNCSSTQYWDSTAKSCRSIPTCSSATYWDSNTKSCEYRPTCASPSYWNSSTNSCYYPPTTPTTCSSNQYWNGSACIATPSCPSGSYWNSSTYTCSSNTSPSGYCGDRTCQNTETLTSCPTDCGGVSNATTCSQELITLLGTGCHGMGSGWFNSEMTKYALYGTTVIKDCSATYASGCTGGGTSTCNYNGICDSGESSANCSGDCGGVSTTTTCSQELITLLGTGCHSMSSGWFNTEMTKYALFGTTAIKDCATTYASGCIGGGTSSATACNYNNVCDSGESSGSCPGDCGGSSTTYYPPTTSTTCSSNQYWNGSACVSSTSSTTCPSGNYWNGTACVPTTPTDTTSACNYNNVCDSGESSGSCPGDCGGSSTSTTYPSAGWCGDGTCGSGESSSWCSQDCGPLAPSASIWSIFAPIIKVFFK